MSGFRMGPVKLNLKGFRALRTSTEAQKVVMEAAERIADAAGDGYVAEESPGRNRARATVHPTDYDSMRDSAKNLTLLRNLGAGRG